MTTKVIWLVIASLGFAVCGSLCVFKTNMLVAWGRKNYVVRKFYSTWPFPDMIMKPWYPTFLRFFGIMLWVNAVICLINLWQ
jgi:hypothetical protein